MHGNALMEQNESNTGKCLSWIIIKTGSNKLIEGTGELKEGMDKFIMKVF